MMSEINTDMIIASEISHTGPVPSQPGAELLWRFIFTSIQASFPGWPPDWRCVFSQAIHCGLLPASVPQNREDPEGEDHGVATPTLNALEPLLHHRPQTVSAQAGAERRAGHGRGPPPRAAEPLGRQQGRCQDQDLPLDQCSSMRDAQSAWAEPSGRHPPF